MSAREAARVAVAARDAQFAKVEGLTARLDSVRDDLAQKQATLLQLSERHALACFEGDGVADGLRSDIATMKADVEHLEAAIAAGGRLYRDERAKLESLTKEAAKALIVVAQEEASATAQETLRFFRAAVDSHQKYMRLALAAKDEAVKAGVHGHPVLHEDLPHARLEHVSEGLPAILRAAGLRDTWQPRGGEIAPFSEADLLADELPRDPSSPVHARMHPQPAVVAPPEPEDDGLEDPYGEDDCYVDIGTEDEIAAHTQKLFGH